MRVAVHGCTGKMGQLLCDMASRGVYGAELAASVALDADEDPRRHVYRSIRSVKEEADCVIDFSNRSAAIEVASYCRERKIALVIGTTGLDVDDDAAIREASSEIAIFRSSNMSLGVALLADLVSRTASSLPDADIEIIETHHVQKVDAPSGTALMLARRAADARGRGEIHAGRSGHGARKYGEIGVSAVRIGRNVGTHEVLFGMGGETITIKHEMYDRSVLADGAMAAAAFIVGKGPGIYGMSDLIAERGV